VFFLLVVWRKSVEQKGKTCGKQRYVPFLAKAKKKEKLFSLSNKK
jgi:hypothetical protein